MSDTEHFKVVYQFLLYRLVALDGIREGYVYHFVVLDSYHYVALPFKYGLYSTYSETACQYPVACTWAPPSLQVSQYGTATLVQL